MTITTVEKFESATGIKGKGETVEALIPLVEEWIMGYTGQELPDEAGKYPKGYEKIAIEMISYDLNSLSRKGISNERLSRHSISFHAVTDYPQTVLRGLRRKLKW